jgi:hypothetical protein
MSDVNLIAHDDDDSPAECDVDGCHSPYTYYLMLLTKEEIEKESEYNISRHRYHKLCHKHSNMIWTVTTEDIKTWVHPTAAFNP